jgi:hypothetical protein
MSGPESRILQLNDNQRTMLQSFQEIASIDDEYLCMQILQENNWNLDRALNQFVQGQMNEPDNNQPQVGSSSESNVVRRSNRSSDSLPRSGTNSSSSITSSNNHGNVVSDRRGQNQASNEGMLGLLLVPLRWLFQVRPLSLNPDHDSNRFADDFDLKYSNSHPTFYRNSYQSAVSHAFQRSKFLLVYLHSPMHEDTQRFCRGPFSSQPFTSFANDQLVTWAGRVWDPEAYGLSTQLRATTFPFMALLMCQSARSVQIVERFQGILIHFCFIISLARLSSPVYNIIFFSICY